MNKAVLISIQPKWCELIASGKKTVEVRKTKPKIETPFKVYIYCTQGDALAYPCLNTPTFTIHRTNNGTLKGRQMTAEEREKSDHLFANGKVIGEFVCGRIETIGKRGINNNFDYCYQSLNVFGNDDIEVEITAIQKSCIPKVDLNAYGATSMRLFAWHISDLVIYDKPMELSEFRKQCNGECVDTLNKKKCHRILADGFSCDGLLPITRPPQSWCYIEEVNDEQAD